MVGGRFHQWKGRLQPETGGYPVDNGPPFLDPQTGDPVFPGEKLVLVLDRIEGSEAHFKPTGGLAPIHYDFGDGNEHDPSDGRNTSHTYASDGTYTVTITDSYGAVDTLEVVIPPA